MSEKYPPVVEETRRNVPEKNFRYYIIFQFIYNLNLYTYFAIEIEMIIEVEGTSLTLQGLAIELTAEKDRIGIIVKEIMNANRVIQILEKGKILHIK